MAKAWHLLPLRAAESEHLGRRLGIAPIVAQLLLNRGLDDPERIERFLAMPFRGLLDPELLPGAKDAADRILEAVRARELICIYGDYDVDGLTGTAILFELMVRLGACVQHYVPHRLDEGYGLNKEALARLAASGVKLLVTVDCGIGSVAEADEALRLGMELIITDHHEPRRELPKARFLIHPRIPTGVYPFGELSGSGVAFKLAWAICQRHCGASRVTPEFREFLLDSVALAALGMVADWVPLQDENRIIVHHGLARLGRTKNVGLGALLQIAGLAERSEIRATDVSFGLAPRLNAAGRLGCARLVMELLTTKSFDRALELAQVLEGQNGERQHLERRILAEAREMIEQTGACADAALVLSSPDWHAGVIGIVAGRLAEQFGRPVLMIAVRHEHQIGQGSGRSVMGLALHTALEACTAELVNHGGHAVAAGFRIRPDRIETFRRRFIDVVTERMPVGNQFQRLTIDAEVPLSALTARLVQSIERMEPFGAGNPRPRFLAGPLHIADPPRRVGRGERHLQFKVAQNDARLPVIAFGMAERADELMSRQGDCCLVFTPSINEWQGRRSVQLEVTDFQPGPRAVLGG